MKIEQNNKSSQQKKRIFSPYISQLGWQLLLLVALPAFVFTVGIIEVEINSAVFALVIALIYLYYFLGSYATGLCAVVDVLAKSYVTEKLTFLDGHPNVSVFFATSRKTATGTEARKSADSRFAACFSGENGASTFLTSNHFSLEKNKLYTVTYAKRSGILMSVLSKQGEEMLMFGDSWQYPETSG